MDVITFITLDPGLTRKHLTRVGGLPGPNTLHYYKDMQITDVISFITLGPEMLDKDVSLGGVGEHLDAELWPML
jgi:hypothetical protein